MEIEFAVVVAPLKTEEYIEAMIKLTTLSHEGFKVTQQNIIILGNDPYSVYWLEKPHASVENNG